MIRSTVIVEGYTLDLLEEISTDFTYSIQDIRQPDKRTTDWSKTIELPGTPRNNALFAHIFSVNVENDFDPGAVNIGYNFNPNKVAKALVLVDGIEVFRGVIQVLQVTSTGQAIKYETAVTGRLADIFYSMGDSKLSDLDFSDMDHTLNVPHLQDVWANPGSYRYTYPLIDYGLSIDNVTYPISNFAPAIYVKEYIDRIFAAAGFTYVCPLFQTPYFQSLVIPSTEKAQFTVPGSSMAGQFLNVTAKDYSWSNKRAGKWREVNIWWGAIVNPPKGDKYGWMHVPGTEDQANKIVINRSVETSFQLTFVYSCSTGGAYINAKLNGEGLITGIQSHKSSSYTQVVEIPKQAYKAGDVITFSLDVPPGNSARFFPTTKVLAPSPTDDSDYTSDDDLKVEANKFISQKLAQKDFFKSILMMHNLFVYTDELNEKNLYIVPEVQFYDTFAGNAVDWTENIDYSQDVEITPMGELAAREYLLTYKDDSDYYNTLYKNKYNEVYGQYDFKVDNDFQKDTTSIALSFSPTVSVRDNNSRVIPHIYKADQDTGVKSQDAFNTRILVYGGMFPSLNNDGFTYAYWNITDASGNMLKDKLTSYPYAGMTDLPQGFTRDLCFSPPQEIWTKPPGNTYLDVGLYVYWWRDYLEQISNKDSKMVRCYAYLTPNDISKLDFKKLVKVDNTYYQLSKVSSYNPMNNSTTQIELFKSTVQVETVRPGFILHEEGGYLLHSDESPARIPYA